MSNRVLILGATGRFGRHAAEAFWNAGWRVRLFDRTADDLMEAASKADVIVNGWNPPYTQWARQVPRQTAEVIAAATAAGATVLIPGNLYGYGRGSRPVLDATTPKAATNPLGVIRNEMEAAYRDAGLRTIVLRAGDFIDTRASGNWFDMVIAAKAARGRILAPGDRRAAHAWAFLPDIARATVALAEHRERFERFEEILFPGYTLSLDELAELIARASGRAQQVRQMNWLPLRLAAPFWPMGRKLLEMRYLWSMPHSLDGARLDALLPDFRAIDPLVAIGQAIADLQIDPDQPVTGSAAHLAT